jgi:hypothetical protein
MRDAEAGSQKFSSGGEKIICDRFQQFHQIGTKGDLLLLS